MQSVSEDRQIRLFVIMIRVQFLFREHVRLLGNCEKKQARGKR